MKSFTRPLRRKFMENQLRTTSVNGTKNRNEEKQDNIVEWITLFRRNWHIYVDMVLGIKLKPFQMIMIYLMGISDVFFAICNRGGAKSFMAGLGAICKMNLYPYSEVVITSSVVSQANKLAETKIRDELIKKLSPYLLYMYNKEYLVITKSDDGYKIVNTINGSSLIVLPCMDSARGARATLLIYDEVRLLKKNILDSVFEKMAHPRQAIYLNKEEYQTERWMEECQSIYITSARYQYEWFYRQFKTCVTGFFTDKKIKYNIFAGDIYLSIDNGLKTWGDYRKAQAMTSEMDFRMEDLNQMLSESEDAFFNYKSFKENQVIKKCFRPPTELQFYMGEDMGNAPKKENEVRIVAVDYAFATTTSLEKNDNTIILCMSGFWKKNRFERHVDYIEMHPAGDSIGAANRARELFWLYEADYFVPDNRSGGEVLYNATTEPWDANSRAGDWNLHGLTVAEKSQYHVVPDAKLADLRERTVDKNAVPCVIPFIGTADVNSAAWVELKKQLSMNNIKFLISSQDRQTDLEDSGQYFSDFTDSEDLVEELLPYGQTDELVREAVNLKAEFKNDRVKLQEPRSGTKDRTVILSYANFIMSKIENEWNKQNEVQEMDLTEVQLVF